MLDAVRLHMLVMSLTAMACTKVPDAFVCTDDSQCRIEQQEGRCEPSGYCSLPASDCPSRFRYDRSAEVALAGRCVLDVDCDAPFTPSAAVATGRCIEAAPPVVDGALDEWPSELFTTRVTHAEVVANGGVANGTWSADEVANDAEIAATFAWQWDARYLYLAAKVTDDRLVNTNLAVWNNDSIELFVDGEGDRSGPYSASDLQVVLRYDGVRNMARGGADLGDVNEVISKTLDGATSWTAEIAVPFALLGSAAVVPGRELGIDLVVSDRDSDSENVDAERVLIWKEITPEPSPCPGTCTITCKPACSTLHFVPLQLGGA